METKEYAYIRVSSRDQNEGRQKIAMVEYGIAPGNIYMDKQSGKHHCNNPFSLSVRFTPEAVRLILGSFCAFLKTKECVKWKNADLRNGPIPKATMLSMKD